MRISQRILTWSTVFVITVCSFSESKQYKADVLILGAGWTGISAARKLNELGLDNFLILEGADRIGGRNREAHFGGKTVEVGANWIHGTDGNPLFDLAKKYGLEMWIGYDYDDYIYRSDNGTDVTDIADQYMEELDAAIENSEKIRDRKIRRNEPDVSYRSALSMSGWMPDNSIKDAVEFSYFDTEYTVPPDDVSLKHTGMEMNFETFKDEDAFVVDQRGFIHLLKSIMGEFMNENDERLHLETVVKQIVYSKKGVKVITENGDVYKGKFAICTFSAGVLEHNVVEFQPPLPYWKQDVIDNFIIGYYLKIFVKFPNGTRRFWDESTETYHAGSRRGYYTYIQNLEAENLFPAGTNMVLVSVTGQEAERIATRIPKSQVIEELNEVFRNMYGSRAVDIEDVLIPTWIQDPLQFGMYSAWPIGVTGQWFDMLRLPTGALFFAGEHTSKQYYGFLHGAYFEGIRVAEAIHDCHAQKICDDTYYSSHETPHTYKEVLV